MKILRESGPYSAKDHNPSATKYTTNPTNCLQSGPTIQTQATIQTQEGTGVHSLYL
jgi:hypothetical protein